MDHSNLHKHIVTAVKANKIISLLNRPPLPCLATQPHLPAGGKKLALVMLQEWWGLNKSIAITANRFSKEGIHVLVPDLYRGKVAKDHEEAGHHMNGLNWNQAIQDVADCKQHLQSQGYKTGLIGFCMGGALTIAAATKVSGFKAIFPFYGVPEIQKLELNKITAPIFGFFGSEDPLKGFSDSERAKQLQTALQAAKVKYEGCSLKLCGHAFMNQDSKYFNKEAAQFCVSRVVEVMKRI